MNKEQGFDAKTNFAVWRICAWAGPIFLLGFLVSWAIVGKFFPPPAEYWSADEVARFFAESDVRIRIGMTGTLFFASFYMIWSALISSIIQRIEGPDGVLSKIELMGGATTTLAMVLFAIVWLTATFRTGLRTPQDVQLLNDVGWFIFNMTFMVTFFQLIGFGTAILLDKRTIPLFPRWTGWGAYISTLVFLSVLMTPFLQQGPFAWHGLFSYYVALTPFFAWAVAICYYIFKAIDQIEKESQL